MEKAIIIGGLRVEIIETSRIGQAEMINRSTRKDLTNDTLISFVGVINPILSKRP